MSPLWPVFSTFVPVLIEMQTEVSAEMSVVGWFGLVVWFSGLELAFQLVTLWCMVAPNDRASVKKFLRLGACRKSCLEVF